MATWPDEWTQKLEELQAEGLSFAQIASAMTDYFKMPFTGAGVKSKSHRMRYAKGLKQKPSSKPTTSVEINADGTQTVTALMRLEHEPKKDARTLLTLCGYDPDQFEMVSGDYKVYEQHSTQDGTVPQYSIHVKVKPRIAVTPDELVALLNGKVKPVFIERGKTGNNNLIIPLFDLHFGIATYERYKPMLANIQEIIGRGYKHIVIIIGGDLLHSDFMGKTQTVKNTQLDHVDTVKAWSDAKQFIGDVIESSLANSQHVSIRAVGGNHDFDMQWAFVDGLGDRYPQVNVHNTVEYRQAFRLDHVGVMIAHGDVALKKLPMLFATEHSDIWATSTWREIFYGHFHHEIVDDDNGVVLRQMGTPKPADGYEKKNGYTMASKTLKLYEYDSNRLRVTYDA